MHTTFIGAAGHLAADSFGPPTATPVLLLHGGGQTRHSWAGAAQRLAADGWRAITVDLRGHGDSDWDPAGDYRIDAFAADVRAIVDQLDTPPVLVGASLGGLASLIAAGEAPAVEHRALVLVDIAVDIEDDAVSRIVSFMGGARDGFASLEDAGDAIAIYRGGVRPSDLSGLEKNLRLDDDGRWRWHWDPKFLDGDLTPRSSRPPGRLEAAARSLEQPCLLVRGRQSDLLSEEGARRFLDLVPAARLVDVRGAGHMVVGDRNDAFVAAVLSFLDALDEQDGVDIPA
ncbi:MAG TPA: alpha/beta hydrolase [Acidimicrobiales bacterium]|nr:alpha/beta hydrolase [Acidimicrobiales bacterium]